MANIPSESVAALISQVLEILGIAGAAQRDSMTQEVNQFIQLKAGQSMLLGLPEATQQELAKLSEAEVRQALPKYLPESVTKDALEKAARETIPAYLAELTKTVTPEQKNQIKKLLDSVR